MADISSNLAGWWPFNGNGNDYSGNGRHFTLTGTMPYVDGKIGQGCTPSATNYWDIANPTWLSSQTSYTVAYWCQDSGYNINEAILSYGTGAAGGSIVHYPYDTGGGQGFKLFGNGVAFPFKLVGDKPAAGSWQHITLTVAPGSNKVYLNGVLEATDTVNSLATAAALISLRVGMYHNGAQGYTGDIDELRIYLRSLQPDDVTALYRATGGRSQTVPMKSPYFSPAMSPANPSPVLFFD